MRPDFIKTRVDQIDLESIDDLNKILAVKTADPSLMIEIEIFLQQVRRDRRLQLKRDHQQRGQPRLLVHTSLRILINDVNLNHLVEEGRPPMIPSELDLLLKTEVVHKIGIETDPARIRDISRHRIPNTNLTQIRDPNLDQDLPKIRIVS